jgi:hypothetical protein
MVIMPPFLHLRRGEKGEKTRISLLAVSILVLALLISVGVALAQNQPSSQPNPIQTADASALTFDHFFMFLSNHDDSPWWQSSTVVDAAGGVHTTFYTILYIYYAYCATDCGNAANWLETPIADAGTYSSLSFPVLALDPSGHPRLMRYKSPNYTYAECNANCTQASSWTEIELPLDPMANNSPSNARYFALDAQGRPRFVAQFYPGLVYAACDANCTTLANWQSNSLDIGERLSYLQVAINPSGQPRVVGYNDDYGLDYAQCNANCLQASNWSFVTVAADVGDLGEYPIFSLRIDSQGRPRLAFYKALSDDALHYAWSNANYTDPASWSSYDLPLAPADERTLDLAIDSQDRPHITFASDQMDLHYLECTAACETQDAEWTNYVVETGEELDLSDPIPPDSGCSFVGWMLDGYTSLALDTSGNVNISYHARHDQNCGYITTNAHAIRFARAAGSITPPSNTRRVYLPLVKR